MLPGSLFRCQLVVGGGYRALDGVCMWVLPADEGKACIWPIYPYCCRSVDVRRGGCPSVDLRWLLVCTSTKHHHMMDTFSGLWLLFRETVAVLSAVQNGSGLSTEE